MQKKLSCDLLQTEVDFLVEQNGLLYAEMATCENEIHSLNADLLHFKKQFEAQSLFSTKVSEDIIALRACSSTCQNQQESCKIALDAVLKTNAQKSHQYAGFEERNLRNSQIFKVLNERKSTMVSDADQFPGSDSRSRAALEVKVETRQSLQDSLDFLKNELARKLDGQASVKFNFTSEIALLRNNIGVYLSKATPINSSNAVLESERTVAAGQVTAMENRRHELLITLRELRLDIAPVYADRESLTKTVTMVKNAFSASDLEVASSLNIFSQREHELGSLLKKLEKIHQELVPIQERRKNLLDDLSKAEVDRRKHEVESLELTNKLRHAKEMSQAICQRLHDYSVQLKKLTTETNTRPQEISKVEKEAIDLSEIIAKERNTLEKRILEIQNIPLGEIRVIHEGLTRQYAQMDEDSERIFSENFDMSNSIEELDAELETITSTIHNERSLLTDLCASLALLRSHHSHVRRFNPMKQGSPITIASEGCADLLTRFKINEALEESQADKVPIPILVDTIGRLARALESDQSLTRTTQHDLQTSNRTTASVRADIVRLTAEKEEAFLSEQILFSKCIDVLVRNSPNDRVFLCLASLKIGIEELRYILTLIRSQNITSTLFRLDLSNNLLSDDSAGDILRIVTDFHCLTMLDLTGNILSPKAIGQLTNATSTLAGITRVVHTNEYGADKTTVSREGDMIIKAMSGKLIRLEVNCSAQRIFKAVSISSASVCSAVIVPSVKADTYTVKSDQQLIATRKLTVSRKAKHQLLLHQPSPYYSKNNL